MMRGLAGNSNRTIKKIWMVKVQIGIQIGPIHLSLRALGWSRSLQRLREYRIWVTCKVQISRTMVLSMVRIAPMLQSKSIGRQLRFCHHRLNFLKILESPHSSTEIWTITPLKDISRRFCSDLVIQGTRLMKMSRRRRFYRTRIPIKISLMKIMPICWLLSNLPLRTNTFASSWLRSKNSLWKLRKSWRRKDGLSKKCKAFNRTWLW